LFEKIFGKRPDATLYDLMAKAGLIDKIEYAYDANDNVIKETYYHDEVVLFTIEYTYDSSNKLTKMQRIGK